MLLVEIEENDAGQRLDRFLAKRFPDMPKSFMFKAIRNKKIKLNRKRAKPDDRLKTGDTLQLFVSEDLLSKKEVQIEKLPSPDVIFENDDLVIVYKPAGLLSQKDSASCRDSLNDRILSYLFEKGEYDPQKEQSFTPGIAHRLDRNTAGLVIAAKNASAARKLAEDIKNHGIDKHYLAWVTGPVKKQKADLWILKKDLKAEVFAGPHKGAQEAISEIVPLKYLSDQDTSLVEVKLLTGRFHQIRASLAFLGHPLIGDVKYGGKKTGKNYALEAYAIDFSHSRYFSDLGKISVPSRIEF